MTFYSHLICCYFLIIKYSFTTLRNIIFHFMMVSWLLLCFLMFTLFPVLPWCGQFCPASWCLWLCSPTPWACFLEEELHRCDPCPPEKFIPTCAFISFYPLSIRVCVCVCVCVCVLIYKSSLYMKDRAPLLIHCNTVQWRTLKANWVEIKAQSLAH